MKTGDRVRVLESANKLYAGEGVIIQAYFNSWSHLVKMETGRMAGYEGAFRFEELGVEYDCKPNIYEKCDKIIPDCWEEEE